MDGYSVTFFCPDCLGTVNLPCDILVNGKKIKEDYFFCGDDLRVCRANFLLDCIMEQNL